MTTQGISITKGQPRISPSPGQATQSLTCSIRWPACRQFNPLSDPNPAPRHTTNPKRVFALVQRIEGHVVRLMSPPGANRLASGQK